MFTENRAAFLADFGVDVTIDGQAARGIFDAAYVDALGVASVGPVLLAFEADLPGYTVGASLLVNDGISYRIVTPQPDGTGVVLLRLERQ